jgi:hypothetical protein
LTTWCSFYKITHTFLAAKVKALAVERDALLICDATTSFSPKNPFGSEQNSDKNLILRLNPANEYAAASMACALFPVFQNVLPIRFYQ